jgi:hypothetical protein
MNGLNCWFNIADPNVFSFDDSYRARGRLLRIQLAVVSAKDTKPDGAEPSRDEMKYNRF